MPTGNGAFVVHKTLEGAISGYEVVAYDPRLTYFPPLLYGVSGMRSGRLLHTVPDYAAFFYRRGVPMVVSFQNYVLDPGMRGCSSPMQRIHYATDLRWLTRLGVALAGRVTAVSRFTAELAKRDLGIRKPIEVIYNGVDERQFAPAPGASVRGSGPIRVLFSGNPTRRKGADTIGPLAQRLGPDFEILHTSGLRGANLRTKDSVGTNAAAIRCVGAVRHSDMAALYASVDVLFMPTLREGCSLAVLEAMACGLPVVGSDASSMPELVEQNKGGFLHSPRDVDAYAESLRTLADSPAQRRQMGGYNRARVEERFTAERMAARYREVFESML